MVIDVLSQECLEVILTNEALKVVEELEALVIWDGGEGVIWRSTFESWMKGGEWILESIVDHVGVHGAVSKKSFDFGEV